MYRLVAECKVYALRMKNSIATWWHEFSKSKIGVFGLIILVLMVLIVIFADDIATHDPKLMTDSRLQPPSRANLLGTTVTGQDLFSQLLYAGRVSLVIGVITATIIIFIAIIVGLVAGYFGGIIDELLMRTADVFLILPRLPLLIVLAALLGPSIYNIVFVIAVLGWTGPARQIRGLTLSLKNNDYVESTRAAGGSGLHIIFHHILPNVMGIVVAHFVMEVVSVILLETGLSFLGLGDPLRHSWGQILHMAQVYGAFSSGAWWWWMPAGICITVLCFALAFIGTTLNDRFVLKLRWRGKD